MSTERAAPFAPKPPEGWDDHVGFDVDSILLQGMLIVLGVESPSATLCVVEAMRATRMFLLQTLGPTRFVVRGEESDRKYTVLVGNRQRCSCGVALCSHHLFVMLKVLKLPPTSPLAWQAALIDSEVDSILGGDISNSLAGGGRGAPGSVVTAGTSRRDFLRRGSGRTSAGGTLRSQHNSDGDTEKGGADSRGGVGERERKRLDIVPGEVCPVCQEEMEEEGGEEDERRGGGTGAAGTERLLTFCRDGCGNNMHTRCMLMYAEHRRSSGDKPCCPLCRTDWSASAIRALKEEDRCGGGGHSKGKGHRAQQKQRSQGYGLEGREGAGARKRAVPVTCRSCRVRVQAAFFRCLVCTPAGLWDLCRRCYSGAGASTGNKGPCTPAGRRRHPFVQGEAAATHPDWKPADPPQARRTGGLGAGHTRGRAAAGLLSLQGREITTGDFELLLTLDAPPTPSLHEHLLRALPLHVANNDLQQQQQKFNENQPSAIIEAPGTTVSSASPYHQHHANPLSTAVQGQRLSAPPAFPHQPLPATRTSTVLVATGASINDASNYYSSVFNTPATPTAWADTRTRLRQSEVDAASTTPLPGEQVDVDEGEMPLPAPTSGTSPNFPECCCCSSGGGVASGGLEPGSGRESGSYSGEVVLSGLRRLSLRHLPCGHHAHDACLIPILLEGVGRGDPARCSCPEDYLPLFPALVRRAVRGNKNNTLRRPRSEGCGAMAVGEGAVARADSGTNVASGSAVSSDKVKSEAERQPARATAARQALRNGVRGNGNGNDYDSSGGSVDVLGMMLVGAGMKMPPSITATAVSGGRDRTATMATRRSSVSDVKHPRVVDGRGESRRNVSAPDPRSVERRRSTTYGTENGHSACGGNGDAGGGEDVDSDGTRGVVGDCSGAQDIEHMRGNTSQNGAALVGERKRSCAENTAGVSRGLLRRHRRSSGVVRGLTRGGGGIGGRGGGGGGGRSTSGDVDSHCDVDDAEELCTSLTSFRITGNSRSQGNTMSEGKADVVQVSSRDARFVETRHNSENCSVIPPLMAVRNDDSSVLGPTSVSGGVDSSDRENDNAPSKKYSGSTSSSIANLIDRRPVVVPTGGSPSMLPVDDDKHGLSLGNGV